MKNLFTLILTSIVCILTMFSAIADDIDVYKFTTNKPQVLLILDNSGSMRDPVYTFQCMRYVNFRGKKYCVSYQYEKSEKTKMEMAKNALKKILEKNQDVDYGIMKYHENNKVIQKESSRFVHLIKNTNKVRLQTIRSNIEKMTADNGTPLCGTYRNARNYFLKGKYSNVGLGGHRAPKLSCSRSSIIYLSDGTPDGDSQTKNDCKNDASALFNSKIRTYTIGFAKDIDILRKMASNGGGEYYLAKGDDLGEKFQQAMDEIKNSSSTIQTASTTSSNDQFSHGNLVFLNGFAASNKPRWKGNVKKFYMKDGKLYENSATTTLARNPDGTLKTDIMTGGYGKALSDFAKQNYNKRNIYINNGKDTVRVTPEKFRKSLQNMSKETAEWAFGKNRNWVLGDILHSKPITIKYSSTDTRILVGTNAGFLHMFKNTYGAGENPESWAFYPKELTGKLINTLQKNYAKKDEIAKHTYGVDGQVFVYTKDGDNNGVLNNSTKDKAIIFFGLRRGGQYYYAVNVLNPNKPKLLWKYKLPSKGQSWSVPKITYLYDSSGKKTLSMIVAGGYDVNKDKNSSVDGLGRGVFAINVASGKELWRLTSNSPINGAFKHSMPATVATLDSNSDGITDRLYVGDTGGNIWRVDIVPNHTSKNKVSQGINPSEITVFKIAEFGGKDANDRRIFNKIDIVRTFFNGRKVDFLLVGTGTQPNPLERKVKNRFYAIMDFRTSTQLITKKDLTDYPIKNSQLANMTSHINENDAAEKVKATTFTDNNGVEVSRSVGGWYLSLENAGEKAWHSSVTFGGKVGFLTYTPGLNTEGTKCSSGNIGEASLYAIDLRTARSVFNVSGGTFKPKLNQTLNSSDRKIKYGDGIPGKISLHIRTNANKKQFVSLMTTKGEVKIPILGDSSKTADELQKSRRRNNRSYILSGDAN